MDRHGSFEAMLLRWSETSSGGATITLQLADADELEPFKLMTLAKGKQAGQILDISWREVDADNAEADARISAPLRRELCKLAVQWCKLPKFQEWLSTAYSAMWEAARDVGTDAEEVAKIQVCQLCGVTSRKELDTNPEAAKKFHEHIRLPFMFVASATGGVDGNG